MQQWLKLFIKIDLFRNVNDKEQQEQDFKVLEKIFTPRQGNYKNLYYTFISYLDEINKPIQEALDETVLSMSDLF